MDELMEQESCGRNHEGGVIKEEHGGGIMERETWRSNHGEGNIQETWRRKHGAGAARSSQEQPEAAEQPGAARRSQEQPAARGSQEQPGPARSSQEQPGCPTGMRIARKNAYKMPHRYADHS